MKQREGKSVADGKKSKKIAPAPPPPPPTSRFLLSRKVTTPSHTKQEIAKYWKQKRKTEEDHFLDAIKAAARIRARNLSVKFSNQFITVLFYI
uniref:Uncharacterized protein n=1 Tax=Solanum lycopersicum TaxID=4081 RepID=A0A3Q7FTX2_SOLLC